MSDPILTKTNDRFTMFPITYPDLWEYYKMAFSTLWRVEEIDLSQDNADWEKLSGDEQNFIKIVLAFFAVSDGIVFENVNMNFLMEVQIPEARAFYAYQCCNEMVHAETYSILIEKLITDSVEKHKLFKSIDTIDCVKKKAQWALEWFDDTLSFAERLLAFACVEGIFFSGSFCAIFWLKNKGILPGLCFSNELISRDEGLHQNFALKLFGHLQNKPSKERILEIVMSALETEKTFVRDALPVKMIGMDAEKMCTYVTFVAYRILDQLGIDHENVVCPFDWMENISLEGKTNFFEKRVGEYAKYTPEKNDSVRFDVDF